MKNNYKSLTAFIVLLSMLTLKMGALSGVVTIDNSQAASSTNFVSFTTFAAALNTSGITGPLTVNVGGTGPYNEQISFNQITGTSATNTITINGNGYLLTYNANSSSPHTMWLNGIDYLYVNNLRIEGSNSSYAYAVVLTNSSNYNTFSACTFSTPVNGTNYYQIPLMWSYSNQYPGGGNDCGNFNTIQNSTISGGYYAVFHGGLYNAPYTTDNRLLNCHITDYYYYAVVADYSKNFVMKGCQIDRLIRTSLPSTCYVMSSYGSQGLDVENNIIEKVYNTNPSSSGSFYCFYYAGYGNPAGGANPNKFINNIVRNIECNGTIYVFLYAYYGDAKIWHNTISLDHTGSTSSSSTYVFYYVYGGNGLNPSIKNNNITITRGGSGSKYGLYVGNSSLSGAVVDYNNWYINSLGGNNYLANFNGTNVTSIASMQTYSAETNGYSLDPIYTNLATGDLHPTNSSLNHKGAALNIALDNLHAPRSQLTPDIGALEFLSNTCSSTPTNLSVYTPTNALCPGKNANINVNGYTSDLGVTYQWLTSTTSSVGPWTVVSGANSVLYTTPNLNATTYYGVAVSCTLVGTTATVANVINIAGVVTSVVPYHESFEGISTVNELPNCSWFAPNQGNSALTYTGSMNQNRSARTGTKFAAFAAAYVSGTNDFYTNGIQLTAGVTYSASVWYKTDFNGYTNVTNFALKYGTSQTQTGLTTIATTGGPASNGIYTPVSNTFVVATSGLYYVAVEVTTSGSYGTQYLSWDDLDIIIPCSLNTTSVTVSTSTNVVCNGTGVDLSATGADDYVWSTGVTGPNTTEFPNQNTLYSVIATNTLSGCSQTLNTQYITVLPSPNVIVIANKPTVCVGDQVVLSANGAPNFLWSNNAVTSVITVTPSQNTTYTVAGTNTLGCTTSVEYSVVVIPVPTITVNSDVATPNQICKGEYATLTGVGALSFAWASSSNYIQSNVAVVNPVASTVYTVTGTAANGCVGKTTYVLNVEECTGLNKLTALSGISLYPNPTASSFVVESNSTSVKTIEVVDLTGRVILTNTSSAEKININIGNFANGVYYVKVQSEKAIEVIKVVKQ